MLALLLLLEGILSWVLPYPLLALSPPMPLCGGCHFLRASRALFPLSSSILHGSLAPIEMRDFVDGQAIDGNKGPYLAR